MAACKTLTTIARNCGKAAKSGVKSDVYLIAYDDLAFVTGTTEVYTESATGLVTAIQQATPAIDFVKYGTVINQASIKEDYTANDNGSFDVVKELAVLLADISSVDSRRAVEDLFGQPVVALVKLQSGKWISFGLNGQFQLKTSAGTVDASSNGRVVTLSGSDSVLIQAVDPTIITALISAGA